jgi:uncharacterized protein YraI
LLKIRLRITLSLSSVLLCASTALAQWTSVGTGIDYQALTITMGDGTKNNLFMTRMAVANTNCIINSMIASNRVAGARERPTAMAARMEDALNYWGQAWGQRNDVIVAINGSFEDATAPAGVIAGGDIYDGWYATRFGDWGGQMGLVWKFDRSYFIGVCPHYQVSGQTVTLGGVAQTFAGINIPRTNNLIIYTPQYNNNTLTANSGVEVLVGLTTPLKTPNSTVTGTIEQVRINQGSTYIPFDHIVLSGAGSAATYLQTYAQVGQQVQISQSISLYKGYPNLCSTADSRNIINAYGLAQGNFNFLVDGSVIPTSNSGMIIRAPRTFLAYNSTYIFFAVCDGRNPPTSVGMTSDEMGAFCLTNLLATDAVNMDGGGSSVMVVNGAIKNRPSDSGIERAVVNGLMMVNLQPKLVSTNFSAGQAVATTASANMRLGPGTDYHAFTTIAGGAQGTVASHAVNGAYAKSYYWWKCTFGTNTGWIAQTLLVASNTAPSIIQQPVNQFVGPGGNASFTVLASGTGPLGYRWQKNQANLSDGGHYSGSTTNTLTISNVDSNDAASYRCVVTNAYGGATSSPATLAVTTNAFGLVTLTNIPIAAWQTNSSGVLNTNNEGRAISPDGNYVVGLSSSPINLGFFYDVVNNVVRQPNGGGAIPNTPVTGIAYRTSGTNTELILDGMSSGYQTDWMTSDGGLTWGAKRRNTSFTPATQSTANTLGAVLGSDAYYQTIRDSGSINAWVNQGSGTWPGTFAYSAKAVSPDTVGMNGVAGTGRAVGWRITSGVKKNYVLDWNGTGTPTPWYFNGLDGTMKGEAFSISMNSTTNDSIIFGQSPTATDSNSHGYKATFSGSTETSIYRLPNFPDTAGSASLAVPYGCTADGKYAVGMNYRGAEKAVLWDTHDASATNWTVTDLTDVATAGGKLDIFSRLTRAYSVGTNAAGALVVTGVGLDTNSPARTRAFVITVAPLIAQVVPRPTVTISGSYAGGFTFSFPTVASASVMYYLEYTTNLSGAITWTAIGSTPGTGAIASLPDSNPSGSQRCYRIRVE